MTYISTNTQERLQQFFIKNAMTLSVQSDYIVVESSQAYTHQKIQEIIEKAGFCSLISNNKIVRISLSIRSNHSFRY